VVIGSGSEPNRRMQEVISHRVGVRGIKATLKGRFPIVKSRSNAVSVLLKILLKLLVSCGSCDDDCDDDCIIWLGLNRC
jgi:hypothetical protein